MSELIDALNQLQKEKNIEKEVIMQAIEDSLVAACNRDFGKNAIVRVNMDRDTGEISVFVEKTVVEEVEDSSMEISLEEAKMKDFRYELGDVVSIEVTPKNFGRIAAQHARSVIVQKIKEEERRVIFEHFAHKEKDIVTGVVQRFNGKNICISLDDKTDAVLTEKEQVKGEVFHPTDRIKLYIIEVKDTNKGPKILVSRTHPELVKRLFEKEVAEVFDGTVEIKSIAREAGSRTKIAVFSNDANVDPVGACVGMNGARVNAIVNDLQGEKIDIITWDEDPAVLIENALSPSNVVSVSVNEEEKSARVVVPDYQLSLAIGKEGQNARLAAKLTGYKIDIKSETQAAELQEELDFEDDFDLEEEFVEEEGFDGEEFAEEESFDDEEFSGEESFDEEESSEEGETAEEESFDDEEFTGEEDFDMEEVPEQETDFFDEEQEEVQEMDDEETLVSEDVPKE
ncbi:MAG: transcription termination factor NusA [Eubacteriales bacterium]|nr:transcription termination factor NusA [Eubacteriales bacterium]